MQREKIDNTLLYNGDCITDRRNDFLHKLTTGLINENQVICAESLQAKNMVKNSTLAKAISDVGWGELTRQLSPLRKGVM